MKQTEFNQNKIMDKKPISISFANQKGGIGKSTLTILAASWLRCRGIFQRVSRFNLYRNSERKSDDSATQPIRGFRCGVRRAAGSRWKRKD